MNLFDLMGLEAPVVTTEEAPKKTVEKKTEKNKDKEVKNSAKLPVDAYILYQGKVTITKEMLEVEDSVVPNTTIETYLKANYPICNALDFTYEKNTVFCNRALISNSGDIILEEGDMVYYNSYQIELSDIAGKVGHEELLNELNSREALNLPDGTRFEKVGNVILPVLGTASDKELKESLISPVKIIVPGDEEISLTKEGEITLADIKKAVTDKFPALKNKINVGGIDKLGNSVIAYLSSNSDSSSPKETKYQIKENTVVKFYGTQIHENLNPGEYTHKELCKALSSSIPECNTPDSIIVKELKKDNIIVLGVKFGGSKG